MLPTWLTRFWRKIFPPAEAPAPSAEAPAPSADLADTLQQAIERLLEDEGLTGDLVDPAARRLLDWGIAQTTRILEETQGSLQERAARLEALRRRMRAIAREVGQTPPDQQEAALREILETE